MFLTLIAIAVVSFLCLYVIRAPFNYWKNKHVPYPPISHLFGNIAPAVYLKKSIGLVYSDIYREYPSLPYVGFYKIRTPCLLLRDLDLVKDILVKNFSSFVNNDLQIDEKNDPLFARNTFFRKGELWKETRNQITPSYSIRKIKDMFPLMEAAAKNMSKYINNNLVGTSKGVEAKDLCIKYTTDVVASCALGLEGNSFLDPNSDYIKMFKRILSGSLILNIKLLFLVLFPTLSSVIRTKFIPDDVASYYRTIVSKTLEFRNKNNVQRGDFLDAMAELKQKIGASFTHEDITAHVVGFFTDGTETSSILLSFVLYELALQPLIQDKLKIEIEKVCQQNEGKLDYDAVQQITYLDKIIYECLRKNPPVLFVSRVCTKRYCLEFPQKDGASNVTIEPGTPIVVPVLAIHYDPQHYPDPTIFDPERFSTEAKEARHKYSFLAFGEGARFCLGQRFAITQVKVAIANLVSNFEIKLNKKTEIPYQIDSLYFLLKSKNEIRLDFYKRL